MASQRRDYTFVPYKVIEVRHRDFEHPRPRSGHRIVCDDTNLYCFGGYNPSILSTRIDRYYPTWSPDRPLFKELWTFSISTRKWFQNRIARNMPEELASNAMCVEGKYLMIHGGTGEPFGERCNNDILVWSRSADRPMLDRLGVVGIKPPPQYGQSVICHQGYFYTVGGTNGHSYNIDIYRLNLQTLTWEPIFIGTGHDGEPPGRYRHEIVKDENKLYIIGGGTGELAFGLMEIPMFDIENKTWQIVKAKPDESGEIPLIPYGRKCHSAVQINTPGGVQVFVAGGSDGISVFNDVWRLNISDMQWTLMRKTVLPTPLYFHSSTVTSSGCMYVFGGIEPKDDEANRTDTLYKVWLCIPKLSEICFEAILHYCPTIEEIEHSTLLRLGVPSHFVNRLHLLRDEKC